MLPHCLGIFPYVASMVMIVAHLEFAKAELREARPDLRVPAFVDLVLYGSLFLFTSFTFPQIIFEWLPPGYFFGTEFCYCILSLIAKLWLGLLILVNVILTGERAENALGQGALETVR